MTRYLPPLVVAVSALVVLLGVAMGAHIYRWEAVIWTLTIIAMAIGQAILIKTVRLYERRDRL